ncbi:MAG TPA: 50S ribosomal protein L32e [Thermoplasmatales archaeon]|nr:50S ribosomal protein L32e [Thermoplasmatales archaeon]
MEEEEVKIVEKPPKIKANIDNETKRLIMERKKKPRFIRQQLWQFKKLDEKWRRPRGRHSKQRRHFGYRPPIPRIGYSSPKKVRGLHPSGFREKIVYNVNDLEDVDASKEAIRIAGTVGRKKRMEIIAKADEMGIRVLNRVL